jgi:hypothetical protein
MIRIHCSNHYEADTAWRMLCSVCDECFTPVELHLDGFGLLYQVIRLDDGTQTAARPEAPEAHTTQASAA